MFGGGGGTTAPPVEPYVPPPKANSPQSVQAAGDASKKATATGSMSEALAGMGSGGLTTPADTTKKSKLGA